MWLIQPRASQVESTAKKLSIFHQIRVILRAPRGVFLVNFARKKSFKESLRDTP
jgi:hypothetical protein